MSLHTPRKRFGQHFLHDKRVINRIIDTLKIENSDTWVEIGPGQGALTQHLPHALAHLYLIEIDKDLVKSLIATYQAYPHVSIINEDILKVDFNALIKNSQRLRVVGNLPYNISTPIFFHLARFAHCIDDMTFMVQKEVADRLIAQPGNKTYGRLSLTAGLRFRVKRLFDVSPGAFNPPPKVQSSIIRLVPHELQPEPELKDKFDMLVKTAFSKRRKTLKNSLGKLISEESFEQSNIDLKLRPEALSIDDFLKLARRVI